MFKTDIKQTNRQTDTQTDMLKPFQESDTNQEYIYTLIGSSGASFWMLQTFWQNEYTPHLSVMRTKTVIFFHYIGGNVRCNIYYTNKT